MDMILGAKSTGTVFVNVGWLKAIRRTAAYQGRGSPGSVAVRRSANATRTLTPSAVNSTDRCTRKLLITETFFFQGLHEH